MYNFSELLKRIRGEAGLTQEELAGILDVSTILISMIETGHKEASKGFVLKLSEKLGVRPGSILPFLFVDKDSDIGNISNVEKSLLLLGQKLQSHLIHVKAKRLKKYA